MKRRTPAGEGLRDALAARERDRNTRSGWRSHCPEYVGPRSLLARLEAGETVTVPGWRLGGVAQGIDAHQRYCLHPDGTITPTAD